MKRARPPGGGPSIGTVTEATASTQTTEGNPTGQTAPAPTPEETTPPAKRTLFDRMESFVSRLSTRNNFWHRVCSLIWLPFAFRSGIRMRKTDTDEVYRAVLPFRRFNKNWYNAMAGAALLGNAEIAGGMYVFGEAGGDYTVVCKQLNYRFLRPCFGPAEYRIKPTNDLKAQVAGGNEFNVTLDIDVFQVLPEVTPKPADTEPAEKAPAEAEVAGSTAKSEKRDRAARLERIKSREKRVGRVEVTFHVTPKQHQKAKGRYGAKSANKAADKKTDAA